MPVQGKTTIARPSDVAVSRRWYWDVLAALAFAIQAVALARLCRIFPPLAIAVFVVSAALAWRHGRIAWNGFCRTRFVRKDVVKSGGEK